MGIKKKLPPRHADSSRLFKKHYSQKSKPVAAEFNQRPLGPNIEVPPELLVAIKKLAGKLLGEPAGVSEKPDYSGRHNIISIHAGQKRVKQKPTSTLAVIVKVRKKMHSKKIQPKFRIPKRVKVGKVFVPVDVQVGRTFKPHAQGGEICGLHGKGPGTIGCYCYKLITDPNTGNPGRIDLLLTNNHVIGSLVNASADDDVFQFDESLIQGDKIAHGIRMGTVDPTGLSIDAAIANATDDTPESDMNKHLGIQFNDEIVEARVGDTVFKFGAETQRTQGTVIDVHPPDAVVDYQVGPRQIKKALLISSDGPGHFSDGGDSGSLIINANGNPVALLIGADPKQPGTSIAQDLLTIQNDLKFDGIHSVP